MMFSTDVEHQRARKFGPLLNDKFSLIVAILGILLGAECLSVALDEGNLLALLP